jgi:glucan-binding YG repeat protein
MMFKKFFFFGLMIILAGCSAGSSEKSMDDSAGEERAAEKSDKPIESEDESTAISKGNSIEEEPKPIKANEGRMVIYNAELSISVKDFQIALKSLEEKAAHYNGYIVESNSYKEGEEHTGGAMKIRIPADSFQSFLHDAEGVAAETLERSVSGQDVSEEFVDLESRIRSKRVAEERLIDFMKKAEKTEDLLQISADLSVIQEEIEQIEGRMRYLKNQTSFSTVNIHLFENKVIVPSLENGDLNTWERTKKQLATSTNWMLAILSGAVVMVIGNLPFIIVFIILAGAALFWKRKTKGSGKRE